MVHKRPKNFLRVLTMVEVHPREAELLQRFYVLYIADQLRDGAVADVTLVEDEPLDADLRRELLKVSGQVLDVLTREGDASETERLEVVLVHLDELDDEVGAEEADILQLETLDIVIPEVRVLQRLE